MCDSGARFVTSYANRADDQRGDATGRMIAKRTSRSALRPDPRLRSYRGARRSRLDAALRRRVFPAVVSMALVIAGDHHAVPRPGCRAREQLETG